MVGILQRIEKVRKEHLKICEFEMKKFINKYIKIDESPFGHTIITITFGRLRANFYIYPKKEVKKKK